MSQPADGTIPPTAAAAPPAAPLPAPVSAPTAQTIITPSAAATPTAAALAASSSSAPAPPPAASAPLPPAPAAAAAAAAPNGLATQYGVVVWPSLPGLQQAAVGVAPPALPSPHHIQGRGGMLGAGMQQGLPAGAVPPGVQADWSAAAPTPTKARRSKGRANSAKKGAADQEAAAAALTDRDTMVVLRSACDACHRMKRKCNGLQPCDRCRRRSRPCGYSYKQKSGPPKGSKRKLIAADEDLLENRQSRPKLLSVSMWPKEGQENHAAAATAHATATAAQAAMHAAAVTGGQPPGSGPSAAVNISAPPTAAPPGANGINRLLAVGGRP
ncbi:unnamed protein product, partial [Scytosiphon promiscuus]